jgi:hypothetical protein
VTECDQFLWRVDTLGRFHIPGSAVLRRTRPVTTPEGDFLGRLRGYTRSGPDRVAPVLVGAEASTPLVAHSLSRAALAARGAMPMQSSRARDLFRRAERIEFESAAEATNRGLTSPTSSRGSR